jgi:APA family basic amino acid/polyamine antiporter
MARDGHLPSGLSAVHPRYGVPHRAEVAVGALVAVVAAVADVRAAIGFSSFAVLLYYAIANASAWTLSPSAARRVIPAIGLGGCLLLMGTLPHGAAVAGLAVVVLGAAVWAIQRSR